MPGIAASAARKLQLAASKAGIDRLRRLAQADPAREPEFAEALVQHAKQLEAAGRSPESLVYIREAKQIYRDRIREWNRDEVQLAGCLGLEATWLAASRDPGAEELFTEEAAVYTELARTVPTTQLLQWAAIYQTVLQESLAEKRYRSAENTARAAIELASRMRGQEPGAGEYLVNLYTSLVLSLAGQKRYPEALDEALRADQIARQEADTGQPTDYQIPIPALIEWVASQFDSSEAAAAIRRATPQDLIWRDRDRS